ncbi:MAG TPA: SCO family protein [Polyangia bacterium]
MRRAAARAALLAALVLAAAAPVRAAEPLPKELEGVGVTEHLGATIPLDTVFTDWRGQKVRLGDYFKDGKPVLLSLNYYTCPMLCGLQLNGMVNAMRKLDWTAGKQYRVVTISIDPHETATLADGKRQAFLGEYGRGPADWSFLTGTEPEIQRVAAAVGFGYRYDPSQKQYAHPAVLFVVSPTGMVSRYLYGIEYQTGDLKFSLMDASQGKTASTIDKLILSCFHFDSSTGRYTPWAFGIMRLGGSLTVVLLAVLLGVMWTRERRRRRGGPTPAGAPHDREAHA